jgi:uncharacterized protein involved in response to NO
MRVFLSYAFRPFFLLNALFAVGVMIVWGLTLHGYVPRFMPSNIVHWHAHEMLVGFGMAAVAGFVLTAVATWTGRPAVQGAELGVLVFAWLAGRAAMLVSGVLSANTVMVIDMTFPALLLFFVSREIFAVDNRRNFPIIVIAFLLAFLNFIYHSGITGLLPMAANAERMALFLLVHLMLLLVTVIGGRIIPNFSANWLRANGDTQLPQTRPMLDRATILITVATGLFASVVPMRPITGVLALIAALLHAVRLAGWCGLKTRHEPLLFILHLAYAWLPAGYALTGVAVFWQRLQPTAALHALTVGAIGLMVMAVTTRVALAHTGRPLHAARLTIWAYWALAMAALLRVVSPFGSWYLVVLDAAILFWMMSFVLFFFVYKPILLAERIDE